MLLSVCVLCGVVLLVFGRGVVELQLPLSEVVVIEWLAVFILWLISGFS